MPKPRKDILFKGTFLPATPGGRYVEGSILPFFVRLTPAYQWISRELSVPVPHIISAEPFRNNRALKIAFYNHIENRHEECFLCAMDLLGIGLYSTRKILALAEAIKEARNLPAQEAPLEATGCETCGDQDAAMVHMLYVTSIGIYPVLGLFHWQHRRRLLCRRHATRQVMGGIARNALLGNLGFPGVLLTPIAIASSLWSLRKAHRAGWGAILMGTLLAVAVPTAAAVAVLYWLGFIGTG